MLFFSDFITFLPEMFIVGTILLLCGSHLFLTPEKNKPYKLIRLVTTGLFLSLVSMLADFQEGTFFNGMASITPIILCLKGILVIFALAIISLGFIMPKLENILTFEYLTLLLFSVLGSLTALSANHAVVLFLALELQILPLYLMIVLPEKNALAFESGLKYFILGGLGTGLFLFGLSFIYGATGTLQFETLSIWILEHIQDTENLLDTSPHLFIGLAFMISALAFKASLVPFHSWTPDVYQGSHTLTTLFLAVCSKIAIVGVLMRLLGDMIAPLIPFIHTPLLIIAVASMLVGALGALAQTNLKRILAYSTISHMGYILSILITTHTEQGVHTALFYLVCYMPTVLVIFSLLLYHQSFSKEPLTLTDLALPFSKRPLISSLMVMGIFSLAGIPPFPIFFGKIFILLHLLKAEAWLLVSTLLISSLIGCYYYLRILGHIYFGTPPPLSHASSSSAS